MRYTMHQLELMFGALFRAAERRAINVLRERAGQYRIL